MGKDQKSLGAYDVLVPAPEDGVGISTVDVEYAQGLSNTLAPMAGWETNAPKWRDGYYIWSRTHIVKTDGEESYSKAVCITGGKGQTGSAGRGVRSIVEQYYISTSSSGLAGGEWSGEYSVPEAGLYVWTRSQITYTDGQVDYTTPICVTGPEGQPGQDAVVYYTWIKYADDANGSGITDNPVDPATGKIKPYIGFAYNKETAEESNNPADYKWSLIKGEQGVPGEPGASGNTFYTWIKYADALAADGYPTSIYDTPTAQTQYIGIAVNKTTVLEGINPKEYSWSRFRGDDGTSFAACGTAKGHYASRSLFDEACQDGEVLMFQTYLVDAASGKALICVWNGGTSVGQSAVEDGLAYYVEETGHMWVSNGNIWVDQGKLRGEDGAPFVGPALTDENVVFAEGSQTAQEATICVEMLEGESYAPIRTGSNGEGRVFRACGKAYGHYGNIASFRQAYANGQISSDRIYLVDDTDADGRAMTCEWDNDEGETVYTVNYGMGYMMNSNNHLWVSEGHKWIDLGEIQNETNPTNGDYVTFKKSGAAKTDVYKQNGSNVLPVGTGSDGWGCSVLGGNAVLADGCLVWSYSVDGTKFKWKLKLLKPFDGRKDIPFRITYKGKVYDRSIHVTVAKRGNCGPALRGPQAWSDLPDGYAFQSGGEGDEWKDVVLFEGHYYSCVKNHYKRSTYGVSNHPYGAVDQEEKNWKLGDEIELVATKILLTTYALVKNLGVETVEMKDASGKVVFQAKGGNVTCKTGIFEDITVKSGNIAGFKISGNGLTNAGFDNDAYVIFRHDAMKAFAGIGGNVLPASSGARAVARFENHDENNSWGLSKNYAMITSARGSRDNVAICMDGGVIQGFAMRNTYIENSKTSYTLSRSDYNVICLNSNDCTVTLPTMNLYDDGHVIRIKRMGSGTVKIKLGKCYTYNGNNSRYDTPCLIYNQDSTLTGTDTLSISSKCDSFELVWCRDFVRTVGNINYYGAWLQYKLPRDW